jgi:hypothetical protein
MSEHNPSMETMKQRNVLIAATVDIFCKGYLSSTAISFRFNQGDIDVRHTGFLSCLHLIHARIVLICLIS